MMTAPRRAHLLLLALAAVLPAACAHTVQRTHVPPAQIATLDQRSPFLKAHLHDGRVYVLSTWSAAEDGAAITGVGSLLDVNRTTVARGTFTLPTDSVALFETNIVRASGASTALTVMYGVTALVAGLCLTDPKACFGSCPTFYVTDAGGAASLEAEGFSASIAPALEATDVDMLHGATAVAGEFVVRVTNEALETHVIRHMDVLAVQRAPGSRVYRTADGAFHALRNARAPLSCAAAGADCTAQLRAVDRIERWSETDSTDLAARETIELVFERPPPGPLGLAITSRQTLLTTFLIYQALAYMGRDAGRWLTSLAQDAPAERPRYAGIAQLLGDIEVLVEDAAGQWVAAGSAGETGPLARDTRLVLLPEGTLQKDSIRLRLRLTRGLWRLDGVSLGSVGPPVEAARLRPVRVLRDDRADAAAHAQLIDPAATLVTLPGDALDVVYEIPAALAGAELFLEARGYYLEWMREEWLAEEDPLLALRMIADPAGMLRALAPAYKQREASMEAIFWGSRYVR